MSIAARLYRTKIRIQKACDANNRQNSVRLLAASKTKPIEMIEAAYQAGIRDFGENYPQEAVEKIAALSHLSICWHFIGSIQSKKAKIIAQNFSWVHTVPRLKIAQLLSQYATRPLNICIQINTSAEISKSGCMPNELETLVDEITQLPNLKLRGLMCIPKFCNDYDAQLAQYTYIKQQFNVLNQNGASLDTLSIGMSGDLEAAIASNATLVRIGQDIFGARI